MFYNGHHIDKSMVNAPPGCKGQTTCLECTRPVCRYDKNTEEPSKLKVSRILTCPICGKEFEKVDRYQKYCSTECAKHKQKEYAKMYYRKNLKKYQARSRAYNQAHKKELSEYFRKYYQKHKKELDEYRRKYRQGYRKRQDD